jgi:hypothetical protein
LATSFSLKDIFEECSMDERRNLQICLLDRKGVRGSWLDFDWDSITIIERSFSRCHHIIEEIRAFHMILKKEKGASLCKHLARSFILSGQIIALLYREAK